MTSEGFRWFPRPCVEEVAGNGEPALLGHWDWYVMVLPDKRMQKTWQFIEPVFKVV